MLISNTLDNYRTKATFAEKVRSNGSSDARYPARKSFHLLSVGLLHPTYAALKIFSTGRFSTFASTTCSQPGVVRFPSRHLRDHPAFQQRVLLLYALA